MVVWLTHWLKNAANTSFLFPHLLFLTQTPTDRSSDQRRRVSDVVQAFSFDEVSHVGREVLVVSLNIVLQYETAQGASGLVLRRKAGERQSINMFLKNERIDAEVFVGDKEGALLLASLLAMCTDCTYPRIWGLWGQRWDSCWNLETG